MGQEEEEARLARGQQPDALEAHRDLAARPPAELPRAPEHIAVAGGGVQLPKKRGPEHSREVGGGGRTAAAGANGGNREVEAGEAVIGVGNGADAAHQDRPGSEGGRGGAGRRHLHGAAGALHVPSVQQDRSERLAARHGLEDAVARAGDPRKTNLREEHGQRQHRQGRVSQRIAALGRALQPMQTGSRGRREVRGTVGRGGRAKGKRGEVEPERHGEAGGHGPVPQNGRVTVVEDHIPHRQGEDASVEGYAELGDHGLQQKGRSHVDADRQ
eukprot:scaffold137246_cov187-Phaeocystis_antarctica.AAC.1